MSLTGFLSYSRVNWQQSPSKSTPLSAANLNVMDAGIKNNNDMISNIRDEVTQLNSNLNSEIIRAKESDETLSLKATQNANDISALKTADNVLSSRMDTFTSLPSGSTTGDAELIDIRVPASGFNNNKTYSTAGESVRGQVSVLKGDIVNLDDKNNPLNIMDLSINLLDKNNLTNGWIYIDGNIHDPEGQNRTTDYIPVKSGDVIKTVLFYPNGEYIDNLAMFSWVAYDFAYNQISHFTENNETSITVPSNCKYLRISLSVGYFADGQFPMIYANNLPSEYQEYYKTIKKENLPYSNSILIVNKFDATAKYKRILDAINDASDGDTIFVSAGVYDEVISTTKDLTIIGADRQKCILRNTTGEYNNTPLYVSGNFTMSNMTVRMIADNFDNSKTPGYALHLDREGSGVLRFNNCTFTCNVGSALGAGGQPTQYSYFENCEFICDSPQSGGEPTQGYNYGAIFFHAPLQENVINSGAEFKNCVFRSSINNVITLGSTQDKSWCYLRFINCLAYSYTRKITNIVNEYSGSMVDIAEESYGNNISELNGSLYN